MKNSFIQSNFVFFKIRQIYIAKTKKMSPPKTSPQKYDSKCSKSYSEKCNRDNPTLLKNALNIMIRKTKM